MQITSTTTVELKTFQDAVEFVEKRHHLSKIPEDQMDALCRLSDKHGVSIAHIMAKMGLFPENFDWDKYGPLATKNGTTVAHMAAECGNLPRNFDFEKFGGLENKWGNTVLEFAIESGQAPQKFLDKQKPKIPKM